MKSLNNNNTPKKHRKFMYIKGNIRVTICDKKFKQIKRIANRYRYIEHLDNINHLVHISKYDTEDTNAIESIRDPHDTFEICLMHEMERAIHVAIKTLSKDERRLIFYLYFKRYTLEKVATLENTYKMDIMRRRNKILKKLRRILKHYSSYID